MVMFRGDSHRIPVADHENGASDSPTCTIIAGPKKCDDESAISAGRKSDPGQLALKRVGYSNATEVVYRAYRLARCAGPSESPSRSSRPATPEKPVKEVDRDDTLFST